MSEQIKIEIVCRECDADLHFEINHTPVGLALRVDPCEECIMHRIAGAV